MKFFFDTEFDEDGITINLISIGIVSEDGREYHAVSTQFDPNHCNPWVQANGQMEGNSAVLMGSCQRSNWVSDRYDS